MGRNNKTPPYAAKERYNKLTAVEFSHKVDNLTYWRFQCDCGEIVTKAYSYVRRGKIKSCGCLTRDNLTNLKNKASATSGPEHTAWKVMHYSCSNKKANGWDHIGAKGIKVCDKWADFSLFFSDMGERPSKDHGLSRKDMLGNFTPDNCFWELRSDRNKRLLTTHGLRFSPEWRVWSKIKDSCFNPNNSRWGVTGAIGITMDKRWVKSFESFYEDVGERPDDNYQLRRIEPSRGFNPGNVQWTKIEKHGKTDNPEHISWRAMKERCTNPSNKAFKYYGGAGIKVCPNWMLSFKMFLADMGPKPGQDFSIDRINPFGDYEPNNCRWANWETQSSNKKNTARVKYRGEEISIMKLAERLKIDLRVAFQYVLSGFDGDELEREFTKAA